MKLKNKELADKAELTELVNDMVQYLDMKLIGFRRDYPEDHCIIQTAVSLRNRAFKASNELVANAKP